MFVKRDDIAQFESNVSCHRDNSDQKDLSLMDIHPCHRDNRNRCFERENG